ncbi:MAG TPA: alpha/beta fold hydrolase [Fimbriimonadaceae bacterium]|nr:alpha/beta fold hydrolase [Fimbriimonadaceae bacterium]
MIWLLAALGVYLLILVAVALFSLRPFRTPLFISPGILGAPQEEIEIPSTDGVRVKAWWVPAENARSVAVLCHGYVMNRSELSPVAHWLWQRGVSSMILEFRAHGKTRGGVSTIGLKEADDVAAAVAEARLRSPGAPLALIGSSMGSAACAFAMSRGIEADALVLDSCYSQLTSAAFGWWRFLGGPILSFLLGPTVAIAGPLAGINPFRVDVAKALSKGAGPVLVLHGRQDDLALPSEAERNIAALGSRAEAVWFDNCGHSEFRWEQPERYYAVLEAFLTRHGLMAGK